MEVALIEDRILKDNSDAQDSSHDSSRATGLGRLLVYAMLDAQELGSDAVVRALLQTIDVVKSEFRLTDREIMRS